MNSWFSLHLLSPALIWPPDHPARFGYGRSSKRWSGDRPRGCGGLKTPGTDSCKDGISKIEGDAWAGPALVRNAGALHERYFRLAIRPPTFTAYSPVSLHGERRDFQTPGRAKLVRSAGPAQETSEDRTTHPTSFSATLSITPLL